MPRHPMRRFGVACGVLVVVAVVSALSAACSGGSSGPPSSPSGGPSAQDSTGVAGAVVGGARPVTVHVPPGYREGSPAPLLVLLHGYSSNPVAVDGYFFLQSELDRRGFLYVVPEGTQNSDNNRFWNGTDACCDIDRKDVDDSGYLAGVIRQIQDRYSVDPRRIYVVGHSNGGFMAHRMACDHSDTVAAIVSVAGAMYADAARCRAKNPVSVLQVHGNADRVIDYQGGTISGVPFPSARTTVDDWAALDGCAPTPADAGRLDAAQSADMVSDASPLPGAETGVQTFRQHCAAGSEVQLWTIDGGGHVPGFTNDFRHRLVDFLLSHPKA
jgi:polyhydroxybutyrate depolymerase